MKIFITNLVRVILLSLILLCLNAYRPVVAMDAEWNVELNQSFLDCSGSQVCYQLSIENNQAQSWALGDQNYRLFFDGDLMTVVSVSSLLPSNIYAPASIDQNIKISGQGQEAVSPLDNIDDNLGFVDFSIIQSDKSNPNAATQVVAGTFVSVAEICVLVTDPALNSNDCLSFYHSRPETAGGITNQYTVISENNAPGGTVSTTGAGFDDLTEEDGDEACLSNSCAAAGDWDIQFSQSFLDCSGNQVCYQLELTTQNTSNWALGDQNYRLFFDGDLMTVVSVTSLLPSIVYQPVNINQNMKISGQGQEAASPLDEIDDNLGFLDFNIIQIDKNPSAAIMLSNGVITPIAEICVTADFGTTSSDDCLSFYHSRPETAGNFTNQYTVISENDAPGSTTQTEGGLYDDLTSTDPEACSGNFCQQKSWDIQFSIANLDCDAQQVCYNLELKNNNGADWALGDQNYRFFFDGDLMTITSVISVLPSNIYDDVVLEQNVKISGQGQEASSPLNEIDDNLGFLDFTIVQNDKSNPNAATQIVFSDFTPVAEICVDVDPIVFSNVNECLGFYHSRPETAGSFTNQYIVISQNDAPESTQPTSGGDYNDLNSEDGEASCLLLACEDFVCDLEVVIAPPIYNDNNTPNNLTDDTFTFNAQINGSNILGWEGGGQIGTYGQTFTFGPYPVDQEGAIFIINDVALDETCGTNIGVNMNSCIYTGECVCCDSND